MNLRTLTSKTSSLLRAWAQREYNPLGMRGSWSEDRNLSNVWPYAYTILASGILSVFGKGTSVAESRGWVSKYYNYVSENIHVSISVVYFSDSRHQLFISGLKEEPRLWSMSLSIGLPRTKLTYSEPWDINQLIKNINSRGQFNSNFPGSDGEFWVNRTGVLEVISRERLLAKHDLSVRLMNGWL